ncbi:MAG: spore germination protein, partial [Dethiobacteraceae bacterium]
MPSAFSMLRKLLKYKLADNSSEEKQAGCRGDAIRQEDSPLLEKRLDLIRKRLGESKDIVIREFSSNNNQVKLAILYVDGLVDRRLINDHIIRPIQSDFVVKNFSHRLAEKNALQLLKKHITSISEVAEAANLTQAIRMMFSGDTALLINGEEKILVYSTRAWDRRAVTEPETEPAVRGSREGFTETLRTNTALLRRRIRHENLRLESMKAGRRTGTDVVLAYINDIINPLTLEEVRRRIAAIDTDSILESGYIEEFIEDVPFSIFPQLERTERADKAAAAILDGRILIMVDNTPHVLIVPTSFFQFIQASEDYYERPHIAVVLRLLRLFVLNIALMLPAAYVAIITFHQEMLPTPLLLSIA